MAPNSFVAAEEEGVIAAVVVRQKDWAADVGAELV